MTRCRISGLIGCITGAGILSLSDWSLSRKTKNGSAFSFPYFLRYRFSCGWIFLSYFWTSANFRRNFDANNLKMTYLSLILEKNNSSLDSRLPSWGVIFDLFFSVRFFPFEAQWRESERENRPRSGPWQTSLATGAGGPIRSRETN